jgi:hypothetical protein
MKFEDMRSEHAVKLLETVTRKTLYRITPQVQVGDSVEACRSPLNLRLLPCGPSMRFVSVTSPSHIVSSLV